MRVKGSITVNIEGEENISVLSRAGSTLNALRNGEKVELDRFGEVHDDLDDRVALLFDAFIAALNLRRQNLEHKRAKEERNASPQSP